MSTHAAEQSLTERVAALEESNALILLAMAELSERLTEATQVERIIRRARSGELTGPGRVAMAWHGRVPEFNVPAIEAGAAVSGPVHHHREAA